MTDPIQAGLQVALIRGCHVMAKGDPAQAVAIMPKILARGLLMNTAFLGKAAYAYYVDIVLSTRRQEPMVVFDVADKYVTKVFNPLPQAPHFAFMKMYDPHLTYIPITVLGFVNFLNPLLPAYNGVIGFV